MCMFEWSAHLGGFGLSDGTFHIYCYTGMRDGLHPHTYILHTQEWSHVHTYVRMSHATLYIHCLYTITDPVYSKLRPLEVHDADGPIATLSNTPLYSLLRGEGQKGPLLKGNDILCGGSMLKITMQCMMKHLCTVNATLHTCIAT